MEANKSHQLVEDVINRVSDGFVSLDNQWHYTFVNKQAAAMFGRDVKDLIGKHIWTEFPEGVGQPFYHAYQKAMNEQNPVFLEEYYPPFDRWFENRIYPSPLGLTIYFHDITERKKAEIALGRTKDLLNRAQKVGNIGSWTFKVADGSIEWSDQLYIIFGRDKFETPVTYPLLVSWLHPDDVDLHHQYLNKMLNLTPETISTINDLHYRLIRPDESVHFVRATFECEFDQQNKPVQFFGIVQDITTEQIAKDSLIESERQLRLITNNAPVLIAHCGLDQHYKFVNKAYAALFKSTPEQIIGMHPKDVLGEKAYLNALPHIMRVLAGEHTGYEARVGKRNESQRLLNVRYAPEFNADNKVVGFIGAIVDITVRREAEDNVNKLAMAVEQTPNAIFITDLQSKIEYVNQAFTEVTGYTLNDVIDKKPRVLQSNLQTPSAYDSIFTQLNVGEKWRGELVNQHKNGQDYVVMLLITPLRDTSGIITSYLAIMDNITEKKQTEARIQQLAYFDQLTGLPNREKLTDRFNYTLHLAERNEDSFALMFLDLDHFKNINDTLGHSVGDLILLEVSNRLKHILREEDTLCRMGGDEFILLLPKTDVDGARDVASRIISIISLPSQIEGHELTSTVSIGIAIYPNDGQEFETLSKNADAAMYRVKKSTRNDYRFFTEEMQAHSARSLRVTNALRYALERNELSLHYQPQLCIDEAKIIGAEALLRWQHPQMGEISPAEFIHIAEDSGQILKIGEWVIRTAVNQLKQWLDNGMAPMMMAVNISAVQFRHPNLPVLVTEILDQVQLPREYLELELTEAVAMDDPQAAINIMNTLHDLNIRMSIDDFGTGYSSLSYLKKFKAYKLKIDQSFVRDINDDVDDKAIVSAIINLANSMGMKTIAEGVETANQLKCLRDSGCKEAQGYYFSKPLPADQFEAFVKKYAFEF